MSSNSHFHKIKALNYASVFSFFDSLSFSSHLPVSICQDSSLVIHIVSQHFKILKNYVQFLSFLSRPDFPFLFISLSYLLLPSLTFLFQLPITE